MRRELVNSFIKAADDRIKQEQAQAQAQMEAQMGVQPDYAKGLTRADVDNILKSYDSQQEIPKLEQNTTPTTPTTPTPSIADELERMKKVKADTTTPRTEGEQKAIDTYYNGLMEASGKTPKQNTPKVDYKAEIDRMNALKADTTAQRTEGENKAIDEYLKGLTEAQAYVDSQRKATQAKSTSTSKKSTQTKAEKQPLVTVRTNEDGTRNYTKTMSANEQRDYERALEAQARAVGREAKKNATPKERALSANEQRDYERALEAQAQAKEREKVTTQTVNQPMPTRANERKGDELITGQVVKSPVPEAIPTAEGIQKKSTNPEVNELVPGYNNALAIPQLGVRTQNGYDLARNTALAGALYDGVQEQPKVDDSKWLVKKEELDSMMQDENFANDMEKLRQVEFANANQDATVSEEWAKEYGAKAITGGYTEDEYYKLLENKYNLSKAQLQDITDTLQYYERENERAIAARDFQQFGENHPILGTLGSYVGTAGNAFEGAWNAGLATLSGDPRTQSHLFDTTKNELRNGVANRFDSDFGKTAYQVGAGLGDLGVGLMYGNAPLMLAGNTAGEATTNAIARGADINMAGLTGIGAGVADYAFNKVGLDKAKSLAMDNLTSAGVKKFLQANAIAGGTEAGENVLQDVVETVIDNVLNGQNSEIRTNYANKIASGMSTSDALASTTWDYIKQLGASGATGFLMGSAMQGIPSLLNGTRAYMSTAPDENYRNRTFWGSVNGENELSPLEENFTDTNVKNNAANPLDNGVSAVDNEIKGDIQNGRLQTDSNINGTGSEEVLRGVREAEPVSQEFRGNEPGGRGQLQADSVFSNDELVKNPRALDANDIETMKKNNIEPAEFVSSNDNASRFSDALMSAKANNTNGAAVDPHSAEDIQRIINDGGKVYLLGDGTMGFAVEGNGNLTAVFKDERNKTKGMASKAALASIKNGATKGDCFGRKLVNMYSMAGYEPVGRMPYSFDIPGMEEMDAQVRRQLDEGLITSPPDVYVLKVRDGYDFNRAASEYNNAKQYSQAELDKLPLFDDYDKMLEYRDSLIGKQPTSEGAFFDGEKITNEPVNTEGNPEEITSEPVNNQPTNPDKRLSNVYTNTLARNKVINMANSTSRINAEYDVHHAKDVIDQAKKTYENNGEEWSKEIINGDRRIDGDDDVATGMLVLLDRAESIRQAQEAGDMNLTAKLVAQRDALGRKLRFAGTKFGQAIKAFDYFRGTAEGAVLNAQRMYDDMGRKWAKSKGNAKQVELNGKLAAAFNKINNPETQTRERVQKSFDQIRTEVKNTIEANKASKMFTDSDIDYLARMIENKIPMDDLTSLLNTKMATGAFDIPQETIDKVNELFNRAQQFGENSKQRVDLETEAFWELANAGGKKSSIAEKFEAWRFLAMLGNPKTHIRNIIGNTLFSGVTGFSNNVAAAMEAAANGASKLFRNGQGIERTKSILNVASEKDRALLKGSGKDANDNAYRQLVGQKYNDNKSVRNAIKEQKEVFNSKTVNALNELNNKALTAEDTFAMKNKYKTSLAGYLKANGLDASIFDDEKAYRQMKQDYDSGSKVVDKAQMDDLGKKVEKLEQAREYAIKQAEYAAFHEDNSVAELLSKWSREANNSDKRGLRMIGKGIEGVLPFKKTPANILRSGVEYSPLNAVNDIYHLIQAGKGNESLSKYFDSFSKTFTGTGLAVLGAYLFDKGILNMSEDDDSKYQDALEGKQNFSLKIGNHTATIDFAVPSVMPLFLGAQTKKIWDSTPGNDGDTFFKHFGDILEDAKDHPMDSLANLATAGSRLLSPVAETSMLSGVNDTLDSIAKGEGLDALANFGLATLTGYATQGIPTVLGQVARTVDPVRRSTYSDSNTTLGRTWDKQIEKIQNKIPFLSMLNKPYLDAYGREQLNSPEELWNKNGDIIKFLGDLAYQSLSPTYIQQINQTPADINAREVYNGLDNEGNPIRDDQVFASIAPLSINGERLSDEDNYKYTKANGETNLAIRNALVGQDWYNALSPLEQNELLKSVDTLTKNYGQYTVAPDSLNVGDELQNFLDASQGYDEKGFATKDLQSGVQAVLEDKEAQYNPYGLGKNRYKELKAEGEDLKKYEGFGEALDASGLDDSKTTEEIWQGKSLDGAYFGRGAEGVQKYADYKQDIKDLEMSDTKKAKQAYVRSGKSGLETIQKQDNTALAAGYVDKDGSPNYESYSKVYSIMGNDSDTRKFKQFQTKMADSNITKEEDYIPKLEEMASLTDAQRGKYAIAMSGKKMDDLGVRGTSAYDKYDYEGYYYYKLLENVADLNGDGKHGKDDRKILMKDWGWNPNSEEYAFYLDLFSTKKK